MKELVYIEESNEHIMMFKPYIFAEFKDRGPLILVEKKDCTDAVFLYNTDHGFTVYNKDMKIKIRR